SHLCSSFSTVQYHSALFNTFQHYLAPLAHHALVCIVIRVILALYGLFKIKTLWQGLINMAGSADPLGIWCSGLLTGKGLCRPARNRESEYPNSSAFSNSKESNPVGILGVWGFLTNISSFACSLFQVFCDIPFPFSES